MRNLNKSFKKQNEISVIYEILNKKIKENIWKNIAIGHTCCCMMKILHIGTH